MYFFKNVQTRLHFFHTLEQKNDNLIVCDGIMSGLCILFDHVRKMVLDILCGKTKYARLGCLRVVVHFSLKMR